MKYHGKICLVYEQPNLWLIKIIPVVEVEKQRAGAAVHSRKTPNDTRLDSQHSYECILVSVLMEDLPRARIKFPQGNERCAFWVLR